MATQTPTSTTPRPQTSADRRRQRSASQRASTLRRLAVVWIAGLLLLVLVATQDRVPVEDLLLDASVVGGARWYSGLVTSLSIVIWSVAVVSAFAAAYVSWLVRRFGASATMFFGGAITSVLLFDDLLMLHSDLIPRLTGLPKIGFVLLEGAAAGVWVLSCGRELARTRWELLLAAAIGFGSSVALDRYPSGSATQALLLEDGAKLLGLLALVAWSVSTAIDLVRSAVRS